MASQMSSQVQETRPVVTRCGINTIAAPPFSHRANKACMEPSERIRTLIFHRNRDQLFAICWPELGDAPLGQLLQQIGRGQKSW